MSRVKVITDSAGDIPSELISGLNIGIVPLSITIDDKTYIDLIELSTKDFWTLADGTDSLPMTAAPSSEAFKDAYRVASSEGFTEIMVVTLSAKLSATYQSAKTAAEEFAAENNTVRIEVLDTELATFGEGKLAVYAAQNSDRPLVELIAEVTSLRERTEVIGTIDTLDNLRKGGRIGAAAATLGSLLSVKPIIEVRDGVVESPSKQRTRKRALDYLIDYCQQRAEIIDEIAVISANAPDTEEFVSRLKGIFPTKTIVVTTIGPVIGSHAGRGTIGVTFTTI
ncbi:MAG: DegV family protein [Actinomycetota bacterium]|nr:DegV family protein [Actinomycetota bacterium]